METIVRIYPSYWAAYLINGDSSGYDDAEIKHIDEVTNGLGHCVGISDETWFQHRHDGNGNQGANVRKYEFVKPLDFETLAKDFFSEDNGLYASYSVKNKKGKYESVCSYEKAIEFAKFAVIEALKAAAEKAIIKEECHEWYDTDYLLEGDEQHYSIETDGDGCPYAIRKYSIDKDSILSAYPIKKQITE